MFFLLKVHCFFFHGLYSWGSGATISSMKFFFLWYSMKLPDYIKNAHSVGQFKSFYLNHFNWIWKIWIIVLCCYYSYYYEKKTKSQTSKVQCNNWKNVLLIKSHAFIEWRNCPIFNNEFTKWVIHSSLIL